MVTRCSATQGLNAEDDVGDPGPVVDGIEHAPAVTEDDDRRRLGSGIGRLEKNGSLAPLLSRVVVRPACA
jgi:hypothetical protein